MNNNNKILNMIYQIKLNNYQMNLNINKLNIYNIYGFKNYNNFWKIQNN